MRILAFIAKLMVTILLIWTFVYVLVRELTPDPGSALSGLNTDLPTRRYLIAELGLDQPFLPALGHQLYKLIRFDFGVSLRTHRPVLIEIAAPLIITASLAVLVAGLAALVAAGSFLMGLVRGVVASSLLTAVTSALSALPGFLLALLLAPWVPNNTHFSFEPFGAHMLLPSFALLIPLIPYSVSIGLSLAQDIRVFPWFETFIAFGFSPPAIVWMRGRRWLLLGFCNVTITAFLVAFTGSVAVELVCGLPGLGTAILDAIDIRDLPVIFAITGLTGTLASAMVLTRDALARYYNV